MLAPMENGTMRISPCTQLASSEVECKFQARIRGDSDMIPNLIMPAVKAKTIVKFSLTYVLAQVVNSLPIPSTFVSGQRTR